MVISKLYSNNSVCWTDWQIKAYWGTDFDFSKRIRLVTHFTKCLAIYPPEVIQVSMQHSKALPFHSSSQHLRSGHSGNCNCYWSSGRRRENYSRTAQVHCATWRKTDCAIVIILNFFYDVLVLYNLLFLKHLGIFWVCPIFLVRNVFQRIPRICAAVKLKRRLCSNTFFALIKYKKHMHCKNGLAVGEKINSFSTAPSFWISPETKETTV